jgi:hypothetical protein
MKKFWKTDLLTFDKLPSEGRFKFEHFLLTVVLIASVFVGIGQIPALYFAIKAELLSVNDSALLMSGLSDYLGKNTLLVVLMIPFVLCLPAIFFAFKYIHKTDYRPFFTTREHFDWKRVLVSFGMWGGLSMLLLVFAFYQSNNLVWNYNPSTFWELLLIALLLVPIQITCEELLFRSYFFKGLSFLKKPFLQIAICGIFFGFMHGGNPEIEKLGQFAILFYIWSGIFLGLITYFDNGIELSLGYHAANNLFGILIVTTNWQALQTDALWLDTSLPAMGWEMGLTLFIWQPLLFFFFKRKYKWGK